MEKVNAQNVIRVAILGPESTGKTSLAKLLSEHYQAADVPEYARQYLTSLNRDYRYADLKKIAEGQLKLKKQIVGQGQQLLFYDTDITVIKIWSEYKYGKCDPWILEALNKDKYDLYLLTDIDIPWTYDPQREHPESREEILQLYKNDLNQRGIPYQLISGNFDQRRAVAIRAVDALLKASSSN